MKLILLTLLWCVGNALFIFCAPPSVSNNNRPMTNAVIMDNFLYEQALRDQQQKQQKAQKQFYDHHLFPVYTPDDYSAQMNENTLNDDGSDGINAANIHGHEMQSPTLTLKTFNPKSLSFKSPVIDIHVPIEFSSKDDKFRLQIPNQPIWQNSIWPSMLWQNPYNVIPRKHYRITLIRHSAQTTTTPTPSPDTEENTIIYVLVKKPDEIVDTTPKVQIHPPEVYFITYKGKSELDKKSHTNLNEE